MMHIVGFWGFGGLLGGGEGESCLGRFVVLSDGCQYTNGLSGKDVLIITIEGMFFVKGNDGYIGTRCLGAWCWSASRAGR